MDCEMCGRTDAQCVALIEGAKLEVCRRCSQHGKVLFTLRDNAPPLPVAPSPSRAEEEIAEDFAKRIRGGREKAGLTRLQLGQQIGEKENYLEAMEQGRVRPTLATAKKLEKALGITLIEKEVPGGASVATGTFRKEVTLADMMEAPKKRK